MKYSLIFLFNIFVLPLCAHALVYDEARVIENNLYITRLEFEDTTLYKCLKKCTRVESAPSAVPQNTYSILNAYGQGLPPIIRGLKSSDGLFAAAFRSDGKNRVIQIVDIKNGKSYARLENISYELLLEETRLLAWRDHELFFLSDMDGYKGIYSTNADTLAAGFNVTKIAGGKFEINEFLPLANGRLVYVANPYGPYDWRLFVKKENIISEIDSGLSNVARVEIFKDDLAYSKMTEAGFEVFLYDEDENRSSKLPMPKAKKFESLSKNSYEARKCGQVSCVLVKPDEQKDAKNLIVWLHGGPHRQSSLILNSIRSYGTYDSMLAHIASETESVVVKIDYPGSVGFGRELTNRIYQNVGKADVESLAEAIQTLKKELGAEKVFIGGTSYGGYLSLKTLADKPDLVDGIFAINSVTDWRYLFDTVYGSPLIKLFGNKKEIVPEHLWSQADIFKNIQNVSKDKKIIVAYGSHDDNVPTSQSRIMTNFLREKKKNVREVVFNNEKHTIIKKSSIKTFCLEFLKLVGSKSKSCPV